jgi:hypothetical protein
MQDEIEALFAYDRWANMKVFNACRKLYELLEGCLLARFQVKFTFQTLSPTSWNCAQTAGLTWRKW